MKSHFVSRIDVNPTISIKNLYTLIGKEVINCMKQYQTQCCIFYNLLLYIKCSNRSIVYLPVQKGYIVMLQISVFS